MGTRGRSSAVRPGGRGWGPDRAYRDREAGSAGEIPVVPDGSGTFDIILPAARKVLEGNREADVPVLMAACDGLLESKLTEAAIEVWNRLAERHRIPFGAVDGTGPALTNATFSTAPTFHGFDWRLPAAEGVSPSSEEPPPGLRLTFSGEQPESCEVLVQFVPLREETDYDLEYVYRTGGIGPGTGLRWRVIHSALAPATPRPGCLRHGYRRRTSTAPPLTAARPGLAPRPDRTAAPDPFDWLRSLGHLRCYVFDVSPEYYGG